VEADADIVPENTNAINTKILNNFFI